VPDVTRNRFRNVTHWLALKAGELRPLWVPGSLLLAGLVGFWISWRAIRESSDEVAAATAGISRSRCDAVPWLRRLDACRGIVLLQLAGNGNSAQKVVAAIRDSGKTEAAVTNVQLDYFLIPSYVAALVFFSATLAALAGFIKLALIRVPLRTILVIAAALAPVAGALDGLENVGLRTMLLAHPIRPHVPEWTYWASLWKWRLIAIGLTVPLAVFTLFVLGALSYVARAGWRLARKALMMRRLGNSHPA
jgi:hypothetical protein